MIKKVKGIKKAVSAWQRTANIAAIVYYDELENRVWCNEYASANDYTDYGTIHIYPICRHDNLHYYKLDMQFLSELIEKRSCGYTSDCFKW